MSEVIDEKVVEMRFDNRDFEENAAKSMSTIGKLKQSLNMDGATKGLENVDKAAKNIDLSGGEQCCRNGAAEIFGDGSGRSNGAGEHCKSSNVHRRKHGESADDRLGQGRS